MEYIIFDLEFNQAWNLGEENSPIHSKCPFEIIQIGALKLDKNLQVVSTFDRLVKPALYTKLHPFVHRITGITMDHLTCAKTFKEVYMEFSRLICKDSILCTWGLADMNELIKNVKYHALDISIMSREYINIQHYASTYLHSPKGTHVGLQNAVELLNIPLKHKFHDAFHDACYTAEVFKHIYNDNIQPSLYHPNQGRRVTKNNKRSKLDVEQLIKQFEKMYNRQMTQEEQSIIKLAYMMGRTNQFQSK